MTLTVTPGVSTMPMPAVAPESMRPEISTNPRPCPRMQNCGAAGGGLEEPVAQRLGDKGDAHIVLRERGRAHQACGKPRGDGDPSGDAHGVSSQS